MNDPGQRSDRPEGSEELATSPSLLGRVLANEPSAWNRLVGLYAPLVWHWCRSSGLQEQDQADVFQEVFQAVVSHLDQFHLTAQGTFRGWLRTITRNKVHDLFRRRLHEPIGAGGSAAQRRLSQLPGAALPRLFDEDSQAEKAAEKSLIDRALELIRPEFAERTWQAFWRTAVDEQAAGAVAEDLGMSPGAVRVAKCRVLQRLREVLGDPLGDAISP
jgi:RNA polymerase sigma-70 factor (ECF subfamily)